MTQLAEVWLIAGNGGRFIVLTTASTRSGAWARLFELMGEKNTDANRAKHRRHGCRAVRAVLHEPSTRCRL